MLGPEDRKGTTVRRASEMNEESEGKLLNRFGMYNSTGMGNFTALDEIIDIANKFYFVIYKFFRLFFIPE